MRQMTTLVYFFCMLLFLGSSALEKGEEISQPGRGKTHQESLVDRNEGTTQSPRPGIERTESLGDTESEIDAKDIFLGERLPLAGKTICVDPGHQSQMLKIKVPIAPGQEKMMPNFNIGTAGVESLTFEYAIALETAYELEKGLKALGAQVVLTRDSNDMMVGNLERTRIAQEAGADITLSLHCDGNEDETIHGLSVLYPGNKYIEDSDLLEKSRVLSQAVLKHVIKETEARNRGLSARNDLIVFNYSKNPCTLIELGFLTNPREDSLLNSQEYRSRLVEGIIKGVIEYFKVY